MLPRLPSGLVEEKDVTEKAQATLTAKLSTGMPEIEAVGGILSLKEVSSGLAGLEREHDSLSLIDLEDPNLL